MTGRRRIALALFAASLTVVLTLGTVTALGQTVWQTDGVSLCDEKGGQRDVQMVSDGSGGAIITWPDEREGSSADDIYAQRVDADGNVLWTAGGVTICTEANQQLKPRLESDDSGGAIITWYDERGSAIYTDIYAQRVDTMGNTLWETNGFTVCDASYGQAVPDICTDGSGGAIITWQDYRTGGMGGSASWDIYAQRMSAVGTALWQTDGVTVCTESTEHQEEPVVTSDGSGGATIIWKDQRLGTYDLFAQKLDADGNSLWTANGVSLCVETSWQSGVDLIADSSGGAIAVWQDNRASNADIYAQRVDGSGNALWHTNGVTVCDFSGDQNDPHLVPDGEGGVIITWEDYRDGHDDIYAQRLDGDGNSLWATDGVTVCDAVYQQKNPRIASDNAGGAIIAWEDNRTTSYNIYAQRIDMDGNGLWQDCGVLICGATNFQYDPELVADGYWGAIVAWEDWRDSGTTGWDIYAQRVGGVEEVSLPLVLRKHQ
jgi:hypothetical protein